LSQKRAVSPAVSSREVTLGQMRKIGIHFKQRWDRIRQPVSREISDLRNFWLDIMYACTK